MTEKPSLLILTRLRLKSPIAKEMYLHFKRPDGAFDTTIWMDNPSIPLDTVIKNQMDGRIPNIILAGYGCDYGTIANFRNSEFVKEHGIKLCFQVGDTTNFLEQDACIAMHSIAKYDMLWQTDQGCMDMPVTQELHSFAKNFLNTKDTRLFHVPWGITPESYPDLNKHRDIEVLHAMTADGFWYNRYRGAMFDILHNLGKAGIVKEIMTGYRNPQNGAYSGIYGQAYKEAMQRSKIMLVDTSQRHWMTAKYLEGALSGALLMGDAPWGMDDIFNDDTMAILDYDNLEQDMTKQIKFYLSHDKDRIERTKKLKKLVLENFSNDVIIPKVEAELLKGLE